MNRTLLLCIALLASVLPARAQVSFRREVAPLLLKRCAGCHGEKANLGGYRLQSFAFLQKVGASGKTPVVAGKPESSLLYQRLVTPNADLRMPRGDDPLTLSERAVVRRWILEGAHFDGPDPSALLKTLLGARTHPKALAVYPVPIPVLALALAPGGRVVVVGGYHEVTLWDTQTGTLLRRLGGLPQRIQALELTPDGTTLLVAGGTPGEYGEVALVTVATGDRRVIDTFNDIVLAARFSADQSQIVAGGAENGVRCYETRSGKRLWSTAVHSDWVTAVGMSADNQFVASASRDHTVKVYEAKTGTLFTTYGGHNRQIGRYRGQHPVYALQFDGTTALSAGGGEWIQLWDPVKAKSETGDAGDMEDRFATQGHARYLPHGFTQPVFALALRGPLVFAASGDGTVKSFDLAALQPSRTYTGLTDWAFTVAADPAAGIVVAGSFDGKVAVWDLATGQLRKQFYAQPGRRP